MSKQRTSPITPNTNSKKESEKRIQKHSPTRWARCPATDPSNNYQLSHLHVQNYTEAVLVLWLVWSALSGARHFFDIHFVTLTVSAKLKFGARPPSRLWLCTSKGGQVHPGAGRSAERGGRRRGHRVSASGHQLVGHVAAQDTVPDTRHGPTAFLTLGSQPAW